LEDVLLRLFGAACVLVSTSLWGEMKARSLGWRLNQLLDLQQAFRLLSTEISYTATPLPHAFERIGGRIKGTIGEIFSQASQNMWSSKERGTGAGEAWMQALKQYSGETFLSAEDIKIAEQLGVSLGLSDREGQLKQIQMVSQQIEYALKEARDERNRNERMWRYLGVLGGLALIIFFCKREGIPWILT